jgi:hypothetical protein
MPPVELETRDRLGSVSRQLERARDLTQEEFLERYVIPRRPVVLENAISDWPAMRKWTPEFWSQQYGGREVEIDGTRRLLKEVIQLALQAGGKTPPPYYRNIRLGHEYPELTGDILPYPRVCQPNWFHSAIFRPLRGSLMGYGQYELFIGGAGRSFPYLHFDVPGAHTFIHQLHGRKLLVLFPPDNTPYLYPKEGKDFNVSRIPNVDNVPPDEFPLFSKATRIDAEVRPGDTLFMPFGWWHTARMLSFSISLGIDVANETNWANVKGFLARKARAKLGPLGLLFMAYISAAGFYLSQTSRLPKRIKKP